MKLQYEEKDGGIKILRCYGAGGCGERGTVVLPESIGGMPVTEVGDYIFSAEMREPPSGLWWDDGAGVPDGTSGGEHVSGGEPPSDAGQALCGDRVESVVLPRSLKRIGRYAFYNCDRLRELSFPASISDIGAGAFNGCRKITDLRVDVVKGRKSCLKEILADLNETLTVHYREVPDGREARLFFPLFYEEAVENTPARLLETHVHGCGHRYRYCFADTRFRFHDYDALFIHARTQEAPEHVAALAMGRLRYPLELSREAEREYGTYLLEHPEAAAACLLAEENMDGWRWFVGYFSPDPALSAKNEHAAVGCLGNEGLTVRAREEYYDIKKPVLGETGFDKLIEYTNRAGRTEVTSFLMDARYRACPPRRKKFVL